MILLNDFTDHPSLIVGMSIVIVTLAGVVVALFAYIKVLVNTNMDNMKTLVQKGIESSTELTAAVRSLDNTNQQMMKKVDEIFIETEIGKRIQKSVIPTH